jgi:putative addiction module component (TIGR02574 family)
MKTTDLITEALSLPLEERAILVDSLLKSFNSPQSETEKEWASVAKRRLEQLRSGEVEAVPGDEVFKRLWDRLSK